MFYILIGDLCKIFDFMNMKKKDIVKCLLVFNDDFIMFEYIFGIVIIVCIYFVWNYVIFYVKIGL